MGVRKAGRLIAVSSTSRRTARVIPLSEGARVTPVELFLDLVFVYGFTQVTGFMADELSWHGVARGMAMLGLLWWLWTGFAWLGNIVQADEGPIRIALFAVMAVVFVMAVTIPEAIVDKDGGLWGPWVFAIGYLLVMLIHNATMLYAGRRLPSIRRNTLLLLVPALTAAGLLLIAGKQQENQALQTSLWVAALAVMFVGIFFIRPEGWLINAASHFAERHGLIIIVALGETVVAIGVGVSLEPVSWAIIASSALGIAVMAALWWAYFDVVAPVAEDVLHHQSDAERPKLARDSYSFLHYPMVAGIILLALGLKKVFENLGGPLKPLSLLALFGGASMYLLAHVAFRLRNIKTLNVQRFIVAMLLLVLVPVAMRLPALGSLLLLTVVMVGLVAYEAVAFAASRDRVRHGDTSDGP